jgi:hypothetical protein
MTRKLPIQKHVDPASDPSRCLFSTNDGRRCTMLRAPKHQSLCVFHARREEQILDADRIAIELASLSGEFRTATDLNHVLGKTFALLAAQRIPVRNVLAMGYLAQLILQTLDTVRWEADLIKGYKTWERSTLRRALDNLPGNAPPTAALPENSR